MLFKSLNIFLNIQKIKQYYIYHVQGKTNAGSPYQNMCDTFLFSDIMTLTLYKLPSTTT